MKVLTSKVIRELMELVLDPQYHQSKQSIEGKWIADYNHPFATKGS